MVQKLSPDTTVHVAPALFAGETTRGWIGESVTAAEPD
jgi:hypothetical protein